MILIMIKIIFRKKDLLKSLEYQRKIENLHFHKTNHMKKDKKLL